MGKVMSKSDKLVYVFGIILERGVGSLHSRHGSNLIIMGGWLIVVNWLTVFCIFRILL